MTRTSRVCLLGMRLGATLAATFAAKRKDVNSLVLWDPVCMGREYLDELEREHANWLDERARYGSFPETDIQNREGTPLPSSLEQQIAAVDLPTVMTLLQQKILLIISEELRSHQALPAEAVRNLLTIERVTDRAPWRFDTLGFGGALPKVAFAKILEWVR